MPSLKKNTYYCTYCGFQVHDVSDWWIKAVGALKCSACGKTDAWKRAPPSYLGKAPEIPENDLWKKLLVIQNPTMFKNGHWKLTSKWKAYLEWLEFEVKPKNPKLYARLKGYIKGPINSAESVENDPE
jgi:hypothetical protein